MKTVYLRITVVCNQSDFKEIYNGSRDDIPDEYRISSIPDIEAEQKDAVKTEEKKPSEIKNGSYSKRN